MTAGSMLPFFQWCQASALGSVRERSARYVFASGPRRAKSFAATR